LPGRCAQRAGFSAEAGQEQEAMNARVPSLTEAETRTTGQRFLCVCADSGRRAWLARALGSLGAIEYATFDPAAFVQKIAALAPSLVFIDFSAAHAVSGLNGGAAGPSGPVGFVTASAMTAAARDAFPGLAIVALGSLADSTGALAALRAGVRDFVDVDGDPFEAIRITNELLEQASLASSTAKIVHAADRRGKLTVLLGARVGVGVSTLAANLAVRLQKRELAAQKTAALLDLGIPCADSSLLLDTQSEFHFVDAVRNLRRFDQTFVHTAFGRHASGLAVTALPTDLSAMREVSYASAVNLLNRLRTFFDHQLVDLGGFSNLEFIAQVLEAADNVWLVCDPNVASAMSAVQLLDGVRADDHKPSAQASPNEKPASNVQLIVSKFDPTLHFGAEQIASRLGLPLLAVLPARAQALGRAVNQGRLLAEVAERDPYVRALDPLVEKLAGARLPSKAKTVINPEHSETKIEPASGIRRLLTTLLKRS
jgi:pilus assembly protein CpaE